MSKKIYMIDRKFGRLKVLYETEPHIKPSGQSMTKYHCICDCGKEVDVVGSKLRTGHTTSCGCHRKELLYKHGYGKLRIYRIWQAMISRCYYKGDAGYKYYGGRGISVCELWLNDFLSFKNWAVSNGYKDYLTIDRIDTNGNYEPSNCRWATYKEQANNKRNNRILTVNGVSMTVSEWSDKTGISPKAIYGRIAKGWDSERVVTTPLRITSRTNHCFGRQESDGMKMGFRKYVKLFLETACEVFFYVIASYALIKLFR